MGTSDMELGSADGQINDFDFDEAEIIVNTKGPILTISFSNDLENILAKRWSKALVVHLLGRKIRYKTLLGRLQELWNMTKFSLIDLGNDFFLANFSNAIDYTRVCLKGPWVIFGSYPNFDAMSNVMDTAVVWIRLPSLPMH